MMLRDKKILIFDLGGVLLDIHIDRAFGALSALGVDALMFAGEDAPINVMMQRYDRGDVSTNEFFEYIESHLPQRVRELPVDELRQRMCDIWNMIIGDFPLYKMQRIMELRKAGHRVLLLSNTNEGHWDEIEHRCLRTVGVAMCECFDELYLSYRMGMCKPEQQIFSELLRSEAAEASDCIFFDDSARNCDAARSVGIDAMLLERNADWPEFIMNN